MRIRIVTEGALCGGWTPPPSRRCAPIHLPRCTGEERRFVDYQSWCTSPEPATFELSTVGLLVR